MSSFLFPWPEDCVGNAYNQAGREGYQRRCFKHKYTQLNTYSLAISPLLFLQSTRVVTLL